MPRVDVVLLVHHHDDSREMYADSLQRAGLSVIAVPDIEDALPVAADVDIVVTGLRFPGPMDGVELMARLRHEDSTRRTPLVALTSCVFPPDRVRAEQAGCDVFLGLPCLPDRLVSEVRRLLALRDLPKPTPARATTGAPLKRRRRTR